jgi:enterobactin synthetase component D
MTSLGMPPTQVHIGMHRQPLWPHGVTGSITHTSRMAMATALVSGACQGVGIDVEQIIAADACAALEGTVIDRIEYELLRAVNGLSYLETATIAFSAKESFYKAAHASVGRFFDFSAARVTDLDTRERTITLELTETLSETFVRGQKCVVSFARPDQNLLLTYFVW